MNDTIFYTMYTGTERERVFDRHAGTWSVGILNIKIEGCEDMCLYVFMYIRYVNMYVDRLADKSTGFLKIYKKA